MYLESAQTERRSGVGVLAHRMQVGEYTQPTRLRSQSANRGAHRE
jgi:hypothetical protein